jgi:hypothetical protein
VAVVEPPRLLEVIRTTDVASLPHVLTSTHAALAAAEAKQATSGAANPRFPSVFEADGSEATSASEPSSDAPSVLVVSDRPELAEAVVARLEAGGARVDVVAGADVEPGFAGALGALEGGAARLGALDAVVVAVATPASSVAVDGWARVLAEHDGIVDHIQADAAWCRAAADRAAATERPIRLITLVDAATAGGRSRAQAAGQLSRAARRATTDLVSAVAVSVEGGDPSTVAEVAAYLVVTGAGADLAGAELVVADGWFGLRSHPRPGGSLVFGGPPLPSWFDGALRALVEGG